MHHSEKDMPATSNGPLAVRNIDMVSGKSECRTGYCAESAVISLAGQDLCLDHFLACCYERLDRLEPMIRSRSLEETERLAARVFLEECSNRVLMVCLRHQRLTNMERSRLLNILLLSGDLQLRLYKPLVKNVDSASDLWSIFLERPSERLKIRWTRKTCDSETSS